MQLTKRTSILGFLFATFFIFFGIMQANVATYVWDPTSISAQTELSTSGGGYYLIRFAPKEWLDLVPLPDEDNGAITSNDFVFKPGYGWIDIFVDQDEIDIKEEANSDNKFQNTYTGTITFPVPGDNNYLRQAVNEDIFSKEGYLLVSHCLDGETMLFGKGKCCAGMLKFNFAGGKKSGDPKQFTGTFTIVQEGMNTKYKGVGSEIKEYQVAVDDETPDVSPGTGTYKLPENTGAIEITALDNAVQGSLIRFEWNSTTNHSTITNGATFQLAGDFTPANGAILVLQATTTSTFAERYRHIPS